jgi:hypothetical protein
MITAEKIHGSFVPIPWLSHLADSRLVKGYCTYPRSPLPSSTVTDTRPGIRQFVAIHILGCEAHADAEGIAG